MILPYFQFSISIHDCLHFHPSWYNKKNVMAVNSLEMRREKNWDFGTGEARLSTDQSSQKLYKAGLFQVRKPFFPHFQRHLSWASKQWTHRIAVVLIADIYDVQNMYEILSFHSVLLGFLAVSNFICLTTYFTIFSHSDNYFLQK